MGETTIAARAQSKYMSLRTTIPIAVVRQLNIKEGDIIVKFRKIKGS
jgi:bifunctional DNA-binding transcriptional regulator/antitoxin component of YhaV-PrlF toxin-antitoxin module